MQAARGHKQYFQALAPLQGDRLAQLENEARDSLRRQGEIEASDTMSFDRYLENFFAGL